MKDSFAREEIERLKSMIERLKSMIEQLKTLSMIKETYPIGHDAPGFYFHVPVNERVRDLSDKVNLLLTELNLTYEPAKTVEQGARLIKTKGDKS